MPHSVQPRPGPWGRLVRLRQHSAFGACAVGLTLAVGSSQAPSDPFRFLAPVATVSPADRRALDAGQARARVLPATGREVAVLAIVPVRIDADRLRSWVERIEAMKKSRAVHAIRRFSEPPRLEDLQALRLEAGDLEAIRDCRPGDCGLKLSAAEMPQLQQAATRRPDWRGSVQEAFRGIALERVRQYRARGSSAIPAYDDSHPPQRPADAFSRLLSRSRPLLVRLPALLSSLDGVPPASDDAFLYWSVEQFGGKPVLSVTDVRIVQPAGDPALPLIVVAGKQVFATHYLNGSLNLTLLLRGREGGPNYLVYLNRSEVDVIGGVFGGLARTIIQRRVRGEASEVLEGLRVRLESGPPPSR